VANVRRDDGVYLEVDASEAAILKECAARVLAGATLAAASRFMNGPDGAAPRRAKAWTRETVRGVLTNVPTAAPADVLTADDRAALRQVLLARRGERRGGRQHSRLLSGLLRCSGCDGPMYVAPRTPGRYSYRCMTGPASGGTCPHPVTVSADAIDAHVAELFLDTYGDQPEYAARATVTGGAAVEAAQDAEAIALAALAASPTPEALAAYQAAQEARKSAEDVPQEVTASLTPTGRTLREAWDLDDDVHRHRELLAANFATLVVLPGQRGRKTFDGRRVVPVMQPLFVGDAREYSMPGRIVADSA
jgi:site-specific DNA recombinase